MLGAAAQRRRGEQQLTAARARATHRRRRGRLHLDGDPGRGAGGGRPARTKRRAGQKLALLQLGPLRLERHPLPDTVHTAGDEPGPVQRTPPASKHQHSCKVSKQILFPPNVFLGIIIICAYQMIEPSIIKKSRGAFQFECVKEGHIGLRNHCRTTNKGIGRTQTAAAASPPTAVTLWMSAFWQAPRPVWGTGMVTSGKQVQYFRPTLPWQKFVRYFGTAKVFFL